MTAGRCGRRACGCTLNSRFIRGNRLLASSLMTVEITVPQRFNINRDIDVFANYNPTQSIVEFQFTLKSWRLMLVVAMNPARMTGPLSTPSSQYGVGHWPE